MVIAFRAIAIWAAVCIASAIPWPPPLQCLLLAPLGVSALVILQAACIDWRADAPRRGPGRWR
jgi:membrane protein implicated in regulation of membrane protease activity